MQFVDATGKDAPVRSDGDGNKTRYPPPKALDKFLEAETLARALPGIASL